MTLRETADHIMERLPGYRAEIIGGILTVTPAPDGPHSRALTTLMLPFLAAGLHDGETAVLQGIGVWLPGGPEEYAIPDLAVVDADFDEHVSNGTNHDPAVFRLVLEVTSSNYNNDLKLKTVAYAKARIPVYVIVDRKHNRVHVLTEPGEEGYGSHRVHAPGERAVIPESVGAGVELDVAAVLKAGRART
nr:Uma2 family endonuclease [Streptomyces sp. NRRL F-4489]